MPDDLSDRQPTRAILIVAAFFLILMAAYFFLREQTAESVQTDLPPSAPTAGSSEDAGRQSQDSKSQEDVSPQGVAGSDGVVPDIAAPDMSAPSDVPQPAGVAQEGGQPDDISPDDSLRDHASLDNTALDIAAHDSTSQSIARPEDMTASRLEETGQSRAGQSEGQKQVPDANARRQTGADNASTQPMVSMPVPSEDSSTSEQDVQPDSMQARPMTGGAHKESHDDVFAQADKLLQEAESLSVDITSGRHRVPDSSGMGDSGSNQAATLPDRVDETVRSPSETVLPHSENRLSQMDSGKSQESSSDKVQVIPEFDIVRVDPNGTAVISGRAAPNSTVQVIVNGEEKHRVRVDDTGEFAIIFDLDTESSALEITLRAETDDGQMIVSEQSVLVLQTDPVPTATAGMPDDEVPPVAAGPETMSAEGIQPTVLLSSSTGVSLLQQEFPLLDQETLVETVSYDETGEAILGGRASNLDSIVRIYLDNQFIKDADVRADMTWSTSLQEILPGRYALRIDEISSLGQVVGRVEMPFQKEDKDFIAAMLESVSQAANAPPGVDTDVQLPQLVTVQRGYTLWGDFAQPLWAWATLRQYFQFESGSDPGS